MNAKNLVWIFLIFLMIGSIQAQSPDDIQISENLVIENVMLVSKPGMAPTPSTIVIKDGLIHVVGARVSVPADAIKIKGDSLYAYPAFIDACSHTGIPKGDKEKRGEKAKNPGNPGWERAGIQPQQEVHDLLKLDDASVTNMRQAGFAISHVVPRGRMLPGQGSIILLNDDETVPYIKRNTSVFGSLSSAQGRVYPSTVIGVMAKYRELFERAKHANSHMTQFQSNPVGLSRPNYPDEIQALVPVQKGQKTFFFQAEKTLDISRAIALNKDLKSKMVLVEAKQAWHNLDDIKRNNMSVLLSLDLPDEMKEEKKDSTMEVDVKKEALIKRKKEAIDAYRGQAKVFADQGIPFSYSYFDSKPKEVMKNLKVLKESGLSDKVLLNSLTMQPAKLLGIDRMAGSVEAGKLANIILTDKPLFEEDMNIHYTIVEGKSYKYDVKKKKKKKEGGAAADGVVFDGTWSVVAKIPDQEETAELTITKNEETYSGKLVDSDGEVTELKEVSIDGNKVNFSFDVESDGFTLEMEVSATIEGDEMEGNISIGEFGSFPFEGTRVSPKK